MHVFRSRWCTECVLSIAWEIPDFTVIIEYMAFTAVLRASWQRLKKVPVCISDTLKYYSNMNHLPFRHLTFYFFCVTMFFFFAPFSQLIGKYRRRNSDSGFAAQDSQIHWSSASLFPKYSRKKSEVLLEIDFSCRNAFFSQILYLSSLNRQVDKNHSGRILFNRSNQHQILPKMWKIDRHNTRFFVLRYLYQFL